MHGKKTDLRRANCAIARSLGVIGDWWSLLIIRDAFRGTDRFSEFQRSLGLARNILSTRLKKLVAEDVLRLEKADDDSAYHRYVLTKKGEGLHIVLVALWQWGETTCFADDEPGLELVDSRNQSLARLEARSRDGMKLSPRDLRFVSRN